MTDNEKREINEYLAERLFGLEYNNQFKEWGTLVDNFKWERQPDYTTEYWRVLEKLKASYLSHEAYEIKIMGNTATQFICAFNTPNKVFSRGDTIGEAVCRCAFECLKSVSK
jgi:hypothetical protein